MNASNPNRRYSASSRRVATPRPASQQPTYRPPSSRPTKRPSGAQSSYRAASARSAYRPSAQQPAYRSAAPRTTQHQHQHPAAYRSVAPRYAGDRSRGMGGMSLQQIKTVLAAAAIIVLVAFLGWSYLTAWRSVPVTVNGNEVQMRINSNVGEFLEANNYFDVQSGNLLSVGGNVLKEGGGERCTVSLGEGDAAEPVASGDFSSTKVDEGAVLTVSNGADTTEPYTEEATVIAPSAQMEVGGAIQFVKQWGKNGKSATWIGEESGERVDKGVVEEPQDFIVTSANVSPSDDKKYMALTFDDGPSTYTEDILSILKEKGAKATFYNLGTNAGSYPDLTKEVLAADCELASHTNAHENLPTLGAEGLRAEISTAFDTIESASGTRPQMIRAPYGAFTVNEWVRAGDLISCNVLWNIDTLDWKRPGADAITNQILSQAFNGAIALMHDGGGNREQNIEALPAIIDGLQDAGYELVTVSELMALDDTFPEDVVNGTVKMPEDAVMPTV